MPKPILLIRAVLLAAAITASGAACAQQHSPEAEVHLYQMEDTPLMHGFYALLAEAHRNGSGASEDLHASIRKLAKDSGHDLQMHGKPMAEHMVIIGDQLLTAAKDDPEMFATYDSFLVALRGPK